MGKSLLILLALFAFTTGAYSQNFTFTKVGPDTASYENGGTFNAYYTYAVLTNSGSVPVKIKFQKMARSFPSGWAADLCYELCYAETEVIPPGDTNYVTLAPGVSDSAFDVTWTVPNPGIGMQTVRMYNYNNPSEYRELTFYLKRTTVSITPISSIVKGFELKQNYPNPFNPATNINFSIPKAQNVSLKVYDMMGREVSELVNQFMQPGEYKADFSGANLSSGLYYYTLKTDEFVSTKSMVLVK
jgi:hypothetical protein